MLRHRWPSVAVLAVGQYALAGQRRDAYPSLACCCTLSFGNGGGLFVTNLQIRNNTIYIIKIICALEFLVEYKTAMPQRTSCSYISESRRLHFLLSMEKPRQS